MDERSPVAALRQLDINYILYVTERNNPKCKQPVSDDWLQGYHQAVKDLASYLGTNHAT
jgi:hypothetical protein